MGGGKAHYVITNDIGCSKIIKIAMTEIKKYLLLIEIIMWISTVITLLMHYSHSYKFDYGVFLLIMTKETLQTMLFRFAQSQFDFSCPFYGTIISFNIIAHTFCLIYEMVTENFSFKSKRPISAFLFMHILNSLIGISVNLELYFNFVLKIKTLIEKN